jgi:hypothetical protein
MLNVKIWPWVECILNFHLTEWNICSEPLKKFPTNYEKKFKQQWSTIPQMSIKWAFTSPITHWTQKGGITIYDIGNPDPDLEQAQKCGMVKPVNGIPILLNAHTKGQKMNDESACNLTIVMFKKQMWVIAITWLPSSKRISS